MSVPGGSWDVSAGPLTPGGKSQGIRHEGSDQLVYAMEDLKRGAALGLRGALVADEGLLLLTKEMKKCGQLPEDFVVKVSVQMGSANPVSVKLMEDIGADTYNVPPALTLSKLAAIRQSIDIPIDLYVEVPDTFGGFLRYYEIPENYPCFGSCIYQIRSSQSPGCIPIRETMGKYEHLTH
ncbi:U32 family peptidase [Peribacillus frigoritolerans]|nr:U32 family peptidase [Peribacillus frigoritolerans]